MTTIKKAKGNAPTAGTSTQQLSPTASKDDKGFRLAALRDLKDVTVDHIPDVRGWRVEVSNGTVIGSVTRIILDQARDNMPRYLDVALDPKLTGETKSDSNEVLLPIGTAQVAKDRDVVLIPSMTEKQLLTLPRLATGAITVAYEQQVAKAFGMTPPERIDELYAMDGFSVPAFMKLRPAAS